VGTSAPIKEFGTPPRKFSFGMMSAEDALDVQLILSPALGAIVPLITAATEASSLDQAAAMQQAIRAITSLDRVEMKKAMKLVFSACSCDGREIGDINLVFQGKPLELWQVFIEALRVNFADFLAAAIAAFAAAKAKWEEMQAKKAA